MNPNHVIEYIRYKTVAWFIQRITVNNNNFGKLQKCLNSGNVDNVSLRILISTVFSSLRHKMLPNTREITVNPLLSPSGGAFCFKHF